MQVVALSYCVNVDHRAVKLTDMIAAVLNFSTLLCRNLVSDSGREDDQQGSVMKAMTNSIVGVVPSALAEEVSDTLMMFVYTLDVLRRRQGQFAAE